MASPDVDAPAVDPGVILVDACGCRREPGGLVPCWNHGRHNPGHEAYRAGLRDAWGWEPTAAREHR